MLTPSGAFTIRVSGPGVVEVHQAPRGAIDLNVYGTTSSSTLNITQAQPRYHKTSQPLTIRYLKIRSGQLGALNAMPVELEARMTPIAGSMSALDIGTIGPKAQVDVNGSVGSMAVNAINLGPSGHVDIAGDINTIAQGTPLPLTLQPVGNNSMGTSTGGTTTGAMTIGTININGGRSSIGRDSLESIAINVSVR